MRGSRALIGAAMAWALLTCGTLFAAQNGVTDKEIHIGASAVLSGPLGPQTLEYGVGARLYFDEVNARGGVHGRKIVYHTVDDAFDVKRAVENTKQLLEQQKVFLIYNNSGTAHTAAVLPMTTAAKTIVFAPVTGATSLRDKYHRYLFHVRAGYADEAARFVKHLQQVGVKRVAAFYQDDGFGKALLAEIEKAAAQRVEIVTIASVDPKKPDFTAAARQIAEAEPQALIMGTAGGIFTGLLKALADTPARPTVYGFSVVSVDQTTKDLGAAARGIVLAQIMPSLNNPANPAVYDYLQLVKAKGDDAMPSNSQFEGYMQARVLVEGLQRAGRDLTSDSLVRAFESAGEITYGKFGVRYSPQSHAGSDYVELAIIDGQGRLRY